MPIKVLSQITGADGANAERTGPIGCMLDYAGLSDPDAAWLVVNGRAISRTTYATLFSRITFTLTGNITNASATISGLSSTDDIRAGMSVEGPGIPTGTTVLSVVNATSITISVNATATTSGATVRFLPWGAGDGSTTFNIPDSQGRIWIPKGTHADVKHLGISDGLVVGSRKIKHKHGKGTISASGGSHSHNAPSPYEGFILWNAGDAVNWPGGTTLPWGQYSGGTAAEPHTHPTSEFSGEVGDVNGPLDAPAHLVGNKIIRVL